MFLWVFILVVGALYGYVGYRSDAWETKRKGNARAEIKLIAAMSFLILSSFFGFYALSKFYSLEDVWVFVFFGVAGGSFGSGVFAYRRTDEYKRQL